MRFATPDLGVLATEGRSLAGLRKKWLASEGKMPPKAKVRSGPPSNPLHGKGYKDAMQEVFSTQGLCLQARDIDQKAVTLLDALDKVGKAEEACEWLKEQLKDISRDKVQNWKAFVYKLLTNFDPEVYGKMKERAGNRRQARKEDKSEAGALNPDAVEFKPGQWWNGDSGASATPVAGYPGYYPYQNMLMMPQMMAAMPAATGAPPPPPPTKAAAVPKAASEAPAPEKSADASVDNQANKDKDAAR